MSLSSTTDAVINIPNECLFYFFKGAEEVNANGGEILTGRKRER